MRALLSILGAVALAAPAAAQTAAQTAAPSFDPAPWWMAQPIIASTGYVEAELPANRAAFTASFQSVQRTAQEANRAAADQVRGVARSLGALGAERVRVATSFDTNPIFEQYRDRQGNLISNQRADRVERYETRGELRVEVRDLRLLEQVYAAVLAARPTAVSSVDFNLQADNEARTRLAGQAVEDAARRARQASELTGARLGPVRLIDATGRACETDVLVAGAPRSPEPGVLPQSVAPPVVAMAPPPMAEVVENVVVTGSRARPSPPPQDLRVPLQAPLFALGARACVVYSLGG